MMLWWCYDDVTIMLWWCYEDVMRMLRWCYDGVTTVHWLCYDDVTIMLWWCHEDVMRMLWRCYDDVMMMLWWCYDDVMTTLWWCCDDVLMLWGSDDDVMIIKNIKIHSSCEIEDIVETHLFKLCVMIILWCYDDVIHNHNTIMMCHDGVMMLRWCYDDAMMVFMMEYDVMMMLLYSPIFTPIFWALICTPVLLPRPNPNLIDEKNVRLITELNRHTTRMKIRGRVVSLSFIFPHPPEDIYIYIKKKSGWRAA